MPAVAIDLDKARRLARARNDSHGGFIGATSYPHNRVRAHEIGVIGEMCMAETYGLPLPKLRTSGGDEGYDFLVQLEDCAMRIDVKTLRRPSGLFIDPAAIACALSNIYVLVHCDEQDRGHLIGWQHRSMIADAPIVQTRIGAAHFVARKDLRPMRDFDRLFALRIAA